MCLETPFLLLEPLAFRVSAFLFFLLGLDFTLQDLRFHRPRSPPNPPTLGGNKINSPQIWGEQIWGEQELQSPPELGDLGGIPGFMQEVYCITAYYAKEQGRVSNVLQRDSLPK